MNGSLKTFLALAYLLQVTVLFCGCLHCHSPLSSWVDPFRTKIFHLLFTESICDQRFLVINLGDTNTIDTNTSLD